MIVSVMSPHTQNNGNTTATILLALGLAGLKRKVLLTHVKEQSEAFSTYLGLQTYVDKTSTPTQLVKLMRDGAINPEDIADYCKQVVEYLDVLTSNRSNFSAEDMGELLDYVMSTSVYDFKVVDIDCDLDNRATKAVLKKSGIIVLNVTQSSTELSDFLAQKEQIMKLCAGKKVLLLCNKYDSVVSTDKSVLKRLQLDTNLLVIRRNSFIDWGANSGNLLQVNKFMKLSDARVLEVSKDVLALTSMVAKAKIRTLGEKRGLFSR